MNLFKRRTAFKPFEYPELSKYKDAIQHSYWIVTHFNFEADIQDFKTRLSPAQREVVKRALLAISQIEVSVKRFWANVGMRFPKPEIEQVGMVFAESEVRHADSYSHLLNVLGLDADFDAVMEVPAIQRRVDYLTEFLHGQQFGGDEQYAMTLTLFSQFIENVSLFAQFLIVKSFNKHLAVLKSVDNVIQATQKEEQVHALFGAHLIRLVRAQKPDWFDEIWWSRLYDASAKALKAELAIVDWILEPGDVPFLPRAHVEAFLKDRINQSFEMIGDLPMGTLKYNVDAEMLAPTRWFEEELYAQTHSDFFHKRPVDYTAGDKPVTGEDLF